MREWLRINHWVGGTIAESPTGAELLRSCRAQVPRGLVMVPWVSESGDKRGFGEGY